MIVAGGMAVIRGTANIHNWFRDFHVTPKFCRAHVDIGLCPSGALDAAMAFADMLPPEVEILTGHSLGGQIAAEIAGMRRAVRKPLTTLVTFDAPKAGGLQLTNILADIEVRQYRFRDSPVTWWPIDFDHHVRVPLIDIGDRTFDPLEAHSITRAADWMQTSSLQLV